MDDGGVLTSVAGLIGAMVGGGAAGGTMLMRQRKKNNGNGGSVLIQLHAIEVAIREGQAESNRRSDAHSKSMDDMASALSHLSGYIEAKLSS
tara:strand:+ start:978 stop:1253 length:276 start_codon:yes stop_codon:yes gene_type:complete